MNSPSAIPIKFIFTTWTPSMTTKSPKEIYSYAQQAMDLLPLDHPHYEEIRELLDLQIKDELTTYANSIPNR